MTMPPPPAAASPPADLPATVVRGGATFPRRALSGRGGSRADRGYQVTLTGLALVLPFLLVVIGGGLTVNAWSALRRFGPAFLWNSTWDPVADIYGAAPMIFDTLVSSIVALLIAVPLALGVAIFLTEFSPKWMRQPVAFLVELLAAV